MAEINGQEKTEQPTGKKLQDTREKGEAPKSMEINSLVIFSGGLILIFLFKDFYGKQLTEICKVTFSSLDVLELNYGLLKMYAAKGFLFYAYTLSPLFIGLVILSLAVGFAQVGFKLTPKALTPKFSKLSITKGIKNKFFSSAPLAELGTSVGKLVIIGSFTYFILEDMMADSVGLLEWSLLEIVNFALDSTIEFLWKVSLVYAVLAIIDLIYQQKKHTKNLMMTKQEVKDEFKQSEGDPLIKGQIKSKQLEMARSRMMKDVPTADVVITNPTHFAVALKYDLNKSKAPIVVAKGMDFVAQKIKKIASENNVPLHEDVQLARSLFKACEVGDEIPENLFKAVAQILAYIFQLKNGNNKKSII